MSIIAVCIWLGMAVALYAGLRARQLTSQPRWHAAAIVGSLAAAFALTVLLTVFLAQRPATGVEDGGGWPDHPSQL
jgi:NO-binding membrane sensor protein with MHYT domain